MFRWGEDEGIECTKRLASRRTRVLTAVTDGVAFPIVRFGQDIQVPQSQRTLSEPLHPSARANLIACLRFTRQRQLALSA